MSTPTPVRIDTTRPGLARMYDYLLGGTENHPVDRDLVDEIAQRDPGVFAAARANRDFLVRAVRFLAQEAGVRQFLDIGSGLPTQDNVHAVVEPIDPSARVVYVDNDATITAHARSLIGGRKTVGVVHGDLADPASILADPQVKSLIDFDQPVALLLVAVLHFIGDDDLATTAVRTLAAALPPGSYLVLSHVSLDGLEELSDTTDKAFGKVKMSVSAGRSRTEIASYFDGFEVLEPGLVETTEWRTEEAGKVSEMIIYAGVAKKN